jgi:(p)ppGpp synthase/HD superfamily hydrolase
MNNHEKLKIALRYWALGRHYYNVVEAMEFASHLHNGVRKDGITPEFDHQLKIAHYLRTIEQSLLYPSETISAALLHDVVEDKPVPLADIVAKFGTQVGEAVNLVTKSQHKSDEQYYADMVNNPIASVVKGADRMHNVQTMVGVFTKDKQHRYVVETETLILPMLKQARRQFPKQDAAYHNIRHILISQCDLIKETV